MRQHVEVGLRMDLAGYVETKGTGISVGGPMGKIQKQGEELAI